MEFEFIKNLKVASDEEIEAYEKKQADSLMAEKRAVIETHYRKESGAPSRYLNESLETYIPSEENRKVYLWICGFAQAVENKENKKNLVFLAGNFGTGKTHLGCGLVRKLGGRIITSMELCISYDSCRDFNAKLTRMQFLKNLCSEPVLVIDEIGKGIESIEKQIYPYIVNEFYGSGRLLVFLGNISKGDFEKIIGEAGADRFQESGIAFSLTGESRRKKQ